MQHKTILIYFTNETSLDALNASEHVDIINKDGREFHSEKRFFGVTESTSYFGSELTQINTETVALLVHDKISPLALATIAEHLIAQGFNCAFITHHKKPVQSVWRAFQATLEGGGVATVVKSDMHERHSPSGDSYRAGLALIHAVIIKGDVPAALKKARSFFEAIIPLEQALNLLHACLTPQGAAAIKESDYPDIWTTVEPLITNLKNTNATSPFDQPYLDFLKTLSDEALNTALS